MLVVVIKNISRIVKSLTLGQGYLFIIVDGVEGCHIVIVHCLSTV